MKVVDISTKKVQCGLHCCLRHVMKLARWTGYFPLQGLGQVTADEVRFNIKCFYSIYHFATLIGQVVMICLSVMHLFREEISLMTVNHILYYVTGLIAALLLIRLAHNWPKLMKMAQETEQSLTMLKISNYTIKKSNGTAYMIMALALVEHIFWVTYYYKLIKECSHDPEVYIYLRDNFVRRMPYFFAYISYSGIIATLAEFANFQATFIWSFTDVMIISFSIYITSYFENLNKLIHSKKENNTYSWGQLRECYSKLAVLLKEMDNQLSSFILLSFFTDQFFICLQLYNSLHPNNSFIKNCGVEETKRVLSSPEYLLYYLSSFLFLVLRAVSLALYAANVHTAAQEPIIPVYDIQASEFDQEVQRFQLQLRFTDVTLSGKFFHVTRSMVLKAIGSIITYELVLLQFSITPHDAQPLINNITAYTDSN